MPSKLNSARTFFRLCVLGFCLLLALYLIQNNQNNVLTLRDNRFDYKSSYPELFTTNNGSADQTFSPKCHVPVLDPWDSSIKEYLGDPEFSLKCKQLQYELTYLDSMGRIMLNETSMKLAGLKIDDISCSFRCFDRIENLDDITLNETDWLLVKFGGKIYCEFFEISCSRKWPISWNIYTNLHAQILEKSIIQNYDNVLKSSETSTFKPNVLLFVLDSMSRSNFVRYLPKFMALLNDSDYRSIFMDSFVKVGDNSFPNAAAILTGKQYCVDKPNALPCDMSQSFYDDWPLIWRNFSHNDYRTYYAEDVLDYQLFNYLAKGFQRRPVDHYLRPYWTKMWPSLLHRNSLRLCYGNRAKYLIQMDYLERFLNAYSSKNYFALNWISELAHDQLNLISVADQEFVEYFQRLKPLLLPNTILMVLGDHGNRFDSIRQTQIGRLEECMPFLAISLPESVRKMKPEWVESLVENSNQLMTPFDIHATLVDILKLSDPRLSNLNYEKSFKYGKSLFKMLPKNRNCFMAGIPDSYCVCDQEIVIKEPEKDSNVAQAASFLVNHVNEFIQKWNHSASSRCAKLFFTKVINAQVRAPKKFSPLKKTFFQTVGHFWKEILSIITFWKKSPQIKMPDLYFRISVLTKPSQAILEALVAYWAPEDQEGKTAAIFDVIGDVSRVNRYGNQSWCVKKMPELKKYCYCLL